VAPHPSSLNSAEELRAALESALGRPLVDARIDSVGMGARNSLWRIRGRDYDWMARIAHERPSLQLDVAQEYAAHAAAAAADLAPRIVLAEPAQRLLVMEFVPGVPWSAADVRSRIARLASRLRTLHALAPPATLASFGLVEGVFSLIDRAHGRGAAGLDTERLRSRATALAKDHRPSGQPAFCHNDLHHLNLLGDQPLFVDWEYAAVGDPLVDLAALATYHDFDLLQRTELLRCYASQRGMADFDVVCALFDALHIAWLLVAGVWDDTPMTRRAALMARVGLQADR
jgi:thiamine kinase